MEGMEGENTTRVSEKTTVQKLQTENQRAPGGAGIGRFFNRFIFLVLVLLVAIGALVIGYVLRQRVNQALAQIETLQGEHEQTQTALAEAQQALEDTEQGLDALTQRYEADIAALQGEMTFSLLLARAQAETAKAQFSLAAEDIGQARQEIQALQASLMGAEALADEEQAAAIAEIQTRADSALADLTDNPFAAQQTLEIIWRDLDDLIGARLMTE